MYAEVILNVPIDNAFTYRIDENTQEAGPGMRAEVRFGNRRMTAFILSIAENPPDNLAEDRIKPLIRLIDTEPLFDTELVRLARWLAHYYLCAAGEALAAMLPSGRREKNNQALPYETLPQKHELSEEQRAAVQGILSGGRMHYLYGPTGSGKTEVFMSVAEEILAQGKSVIYLVPEISLTRQITETVVSRFGNTAALLHSGLTGSQKLSEWNRIRRGQARIVIGARSAVFAPVQKLGAVIIDEEHEGAYKSDAAPRYHARQVALFRCTEQDVPLIMGSATPSVEAWKLMNEGRIQRHVLTQRLAGGSFPHIEIVNLSEQKTEGSISPILRTHIEHTLSEKKQVLLFLNRRGFTHFFRCLTCGYELLCKNCSVALTYHKNERRLRCHYCGWTLEPPRICPDCGSLDVGYAGFGTEFIEEEVKSLFPHAVIDRIDTDNLQHRSSLEEKISAFRNRETDILLGTQMIAKGLNFPALKLVGIILADTSLHMPDFRAAERTYALITQVAGRAGRFFPDGRVIVQSYAPKRQAIACACANDPETFYAEELKQRSLSGFPPFMRLIRLVFRSTQEKKSWNAASSAAVLLTHEAERMRVADSIEILGPCECPLAKIAANYRTQILLRSRQIRDIQSLCRKFLFGYKAPAAVYIEIDTDPVQLL